MTEAHGGAPSAEKKEVSRGTAEALFDELKTEVDVDGATAYEDVSAESIVDHADGHEYDQYDDAEMVTAGDEVDSLLIPERADGEEFRWVETDSIEPATGSGETSEDAEITDGPVANDEIDPFDDVGDLFAESEHDHDERDSEVGPDTTGDGGTETGPGVTGSETAEAAAETNADDRRDSTAFASTTPPQRAIDTDDPADDSEDGIFTRILSFFGLR